VAKPWSHCKARLKKRAKDAACAEIAQEALTHKM